MQSGSFTKALKSSHPDISYHAPPALLPIIRRILLTHYFFSVLFFFLSFCPFQGRTRSIWRFQLGFHRSCTCPPMPEPQQCQIWAVSVTHTTAHSNTGSLTHSISWLLVRFVSAAAWQELLSSSSFFFFFFFFPTVQQGSLFYFKIYLNPETCEKNLSYSDFHCSALYFIWLTSNSHRILLCDTIQVA